MAKHLDPYQTYVIHYWEEQSTQANPGIYRFTLDVPATGERFGFTNSQELLNALKFALAQVQSPAIADATEDVSDQTV